MKPASADLARASLVNELKDVMEKLVPALEKKTNCKIRIFLGAEGFSVQFSNQVTELSQTKIISYNSYVFSEAGLISDTLRQMALIARYGTKSDGKYENEQRNRI